MFRIRKKSQPFPRKLKDLDFILQGDAKKLRKHWNKEFNYLSQFKWTDDTINPVHLAAAEGKDDGLRRLLSSIFSTSAIPKDYVNRRSANGKAPLHFAAQHGNLECTETLLKLRANINVQDLEYGFTALHFACQNSDFCCAKLLLDHYADPKLQDKQGRTPLKLAEEVHNKQLIMLLKDHEKKDDDTTLQLKVKKLEERLDDIEDKFSNLSLCSESVAGGRWKSTTTLNDSGRMTAGSEDAMFEGEISKYNYPEAWKIQRYYEELLDKMIKPEEVMVKLFIKNFVNRKFKAELQNETNDTKKIMKLLDEVMSTNKKMFDAFVDALRKTKQSELADLLCDTTSRPSSCILPMDSDQTLLRDGCPSTSLPHDFTPLPPPSRFQDVLENEDFDHRVTAETKSSEKQHVLQRSKFTQTCYQKNIFSESSTPPKGHQIPNLSITNKLDARKTSVNYQNVRENHIQSVHKSTKQLSQSNFVAQERNHSGYVQHGNDVNTQHKRAKEAITDYNSQSATAVSNPSPLLGHKSTDRPPANMQHRGMNEPQASCNIHQKNELPRYPYATRIHGNPMPCFEKKPEQSYKRGTPALETWKKAADNGTRKYDTLPNELFGSNAHGRLNYHGTNFVGRQMPYYQPGPTDFRA